MLPACQTSQPTRSRKETGQCFREGRDKIQGVQNPKQGNHFAMFEGLIQQIEAHASYGPAMKQAASQQACLILNYHTHGPGTGYCVSICSQQSGLLPVLGQSLPVEELVHVKGIGKTEDQCLSLMAPLSNALVAHYGLEHSPTIHLNGKPFSGSANGSE